MTRRLSSLVCLQSALLVWAATVAAQPPGADEAAVRVVIERFYDGWNTQDFDKLVSAYADDIDHINVFGEWHKGKAEIRKDITDLFNGPAKPGRKVPTIEKVRFVGPTAAVAQVSSISPAGKNLGTYVLEKRPQGWLIVSFTNVIPTTPPYKKK